MDIVNRFGNNLDESYKTLSFQEISFDDFRKFDKVVNKVENIVFRELDSFLHETFEIVDKVLQPLIIVLGFYLQVRSYYGLVVQTSNFDVALSGFFNSIPALSDFQFRSLLILLDSLFSQFFSYLFDGLTLW